MIRSSLSSLRLWVVQSLDLEYFFLKKTRYLQFYKGASVRMGNWTLSGFLIYRQKSFHCVTQALNIPL